MNNGMKISSPQNNITQSVRHSPHKETSEVSLSESYLRARDSVVKAGLPLLFVEKSISPKVVLRQPAAEFFPTGYRGPATEENSRAEAKATASLKSSKDQVFLEAKRFEAPVFVSSLGDLTRLSPGTDLILNTVIHWPKIINEGEIDVSALFTAALFQSGYFLPKNVEYARYIVSEVIPKVEANGLRQAFAEALSVAVLRPNHVPIAEALLDLGADPNWPSYEGRSPLNEALMHTNKDAAKLLLKRGANLLPDFGSESPLEILREEYDSKEDHDLYAAFDQVIKNGPSNPV